MRVASALLLATSTLVTGCVDATGIFNDCASEMAAVRVDEGGPPDATQSDEDRGDHTEVWYFDDSRQKYTFRWGVSYDGCKVERGSFVISPLPDSADR
ncbi:MAG TPA: hypothetical protein VF167_18225 [Longimicrobiaceae bacterium]